MNLLASKADPSTGCTDFHVDRFDLYNAKARAVFVKRAGMELGESEDVLKHDLGCVLLKLEEVQTEPLKAAMAKQDKVPKLSQAEEAEALALLRAPDLLDRILADVAACGVVGEESNKLVGYMAAVSRQLDRPLAAIIQCSSAAGKSSLMDAVLVLMPRGRLRAPLGHDGSKSVLHGRDQPQAQDPGHCRARGRGASRLCLEALAERRPGDAVPDDHGH